MKHDKRCTRSAGTILQKYYSAIILVVLVLLVCSPLQAESQWPRVTQSKDGTAISYQVHGQGEPALIFVHGWSCDSRYWREQIPVFAKSHKVVTIDLAGHGHSGFSRIDYSMEAFGEDVKAVAEALGISQAILIGHSMGGSVIAEAAVLMPEQILGIIGVDTLQDIEYPMTSEELAQMTGPLNTDFPAGAREFVGSMLLPYNESELRHWIVEDMASAPPNVAMSAMNNLLNRYITKRAAAVFDDLKIPVICVNADLWPVNYEANRRHMQSFETFTVASTDHFLMLNKPEPFNAMLKKAIEAIVVKN